MVFMIVHGPRAQTAVDFLTSYGIVIMVIAIAIYVILQLGIFSPQFAPNYCTPAPSFSCSAYVLYPNGTLTILLGQTIGGTITLGGMACSSAINGTGTGPQFGNVNVVGSSQFYLSGGFTKGDTLLSNAPRRLSVYCYDSGSGAPAKGSLGSNFVGYVWLNYTYSGLPGSYDQIQQVISFSVAYT